MSYSNSGRFCLGAFYQDQLIGFVRCVGDGEHIIMVQDLIVTEEFQGKKIGTTLFQKTWDKYSKVRMFQVNTVIDDKHRRLKVGSELVNAVESAYRKGIL